MRGGGGAPQPLAPRLATLSALPRTQWHNLVHLDAIRERSRPQQPPKKPEAAPFFLPTVAGAGHPHVTALRFHSFSVCFRPCRNPL